MEMHPYHHYLFFRLGNGFHRLSEAEQKRARGKFEPLLAEKRDDLVMTSYATLGFRPDNTFMLWVRAKDPRGVQTFLHELQHTEMGQYLTLTHTYFGIERNSEYTGRQGAPQQVMQLHEDRLPYLVLYPFTKTHEWHALDQEARRSMMSEHIKIGQEHKPIRQCLLYSYGVDDHEFLVSYEMNTLEEFQDLVIAMRRTAGRKYTLADTPTYTCIYKTPAELMEIL